MLTRLFINRNSFEIGISQTFYCLRLIIYGHKVISFSAINDDLDSMKSDIEGKVRREMEVNP